MTGLKNAYRKFLIASDELANRIIRGEFVAGKEFMKRSEICDKYGISPVTAQKVQQELVRRNLLIARKGLPFIVASSGERKLPELQEIIYIRQIPTREFGYHGDEIVRGIKQITDAEGIRFREIYLELLDRNKSRISTAFDCDENAGLVLMPYKSIMIRGAAYFLKPGVRRVTVDFPLPETPGVMADNFDGVETLLTTAKENGAKKVMFVSRRSFGANPFDDGDKMSLGRIFASRMGMEYMECISPDNQTVKSEIERLKPDAVILNSYTMGDSSFVERILPHGKGGRPLLMAFTRNFDLEHDHAEDMWFYEIDAKLIGKEAAKILIGQGETSAVSKYIKGKLVPPTSK